MRFKQIPEGEERTRTFFAWWPIWCYKTCETRWLERVTVRECYVYAYASSTWWVVAFID